MPRKIVPPTRTADNGSTKQYCKRCKNWKDQQAHFRSVKGTKIVDICQKCRDNMKAFQALASLSLVLADSASESSTPATKRSTTYAQASPRHRCTLAPTPAYNLYAQIGQSQESAAETAARREREAIQRSHRLIDCTGGDRSQTPTMDELLNQNPATPSPRIYFVCTICLVPRPLGVESSAESICIYCQQNAADSMLELKWCIHGGHESPRHAFARPQTGMEGIELLPKCAHEMPNKRLLPNKRLYTLS